MFKHLLAKRCSHAKIKSNYSSPCGQTASSKRSTKDAIISTKKVFPTLCSNSPFSDCFSSSAAIKGENSAQCSLTWKKVKVESYPFSGKRFPKIFKTPSPLLLLPPLLTSPSNQVDSPPPCSYILMTNPSESPLRNIRHFCTKLSEISVQNRFVGRSVSCQWLTIGQRMPCPGVKSVHTVHTFAGTRTLSAGGYVACSSFISYMTCTKVIVEQLWYFLFFATISAFIVSGSILLRQTEIFKHLITYSAFSFIDKNTRLVRREYFLAVQDACLPIVYLRS